VCLEGYHYFLETLIFYVKQPNIWIKSEVIDAMRFYLVEYADVSNFEPFVDSKRSG
jgi:hypothetical protein